MPKFYAYQFLLNKIKIASSRALHFFNVISLWPVIIRESRGDQREQFEVVSEREEQPGSSWNGIDQGATGREETFEVKEACGCSRVEC